MSAQRLALAGLSNIKCKGIITPSLQKDSGFDDSEQIRRTNRAHNMDSGFFRGEHETTAQQHPFSTGCVGRPQGLPVPYPGSSTQHNPSSLFDDKATVIATADKGPIMASSSLDAHARQPSRTLSFDEQHSLRIDAAIAAEKKAVASIKRMARNNKTALLALWRWSDGNGGGVLDMIAKEIGMRQPSAPLPPAYKIVKGKKVIPADLRKRVFERNAYRCVHCGTHINLTVDHIKPESKGGTLDFDNLQTLCAPCNSSKGAKE